MIIGVVKGDFSWRRRARVWAVKVGWDRWRRFYWYTLGIFLLPFPRHLHPHSHYFLPPFPLFALSLSIFILLSLPIPLFFSLVSSLDTGLSRVFAWYIESLSRYISVYMYTLALYRLIFRFTYYVLCIVMGYSFRNIFFRGMILVIGLLFLFKKKGGIRLRVEISQHNTSSCKTQQRKHAQTKWSILHLLNYAAQQRAF